MGELVDQTKVPEDIHEALRGTPRRTPELQLLDQQIVIQRHAKTISDALSPAEHVYVDYQRHRACHLRQDAYGISVNKDGKGGHALRDVRRLAWLEQKMTIEDAWDAIRRIESEYGGALLVAQALAKRVRPHVEALVLAQAKYDALNVPYPNGTP